MSALLHSFSIVGDSNVRRNLISSNVRGHPHMVHAEFIPCGRLSILGSSLESVRDESDACVVSCLTNFITGSIPASSVGTVAQRVENILNTFMARIRDACRKRPSLNFFVCPPMYHTNPIWYRDGLAEIMSAFSAQASSNSLANFWVIPSFPCPKLE